MNVVLISTYELGRQPFGLSSPAAWLKELGATVTCLDLAIQRLDRQAIAAADLVAFYVPMHTATRLAARLVQQVKQMNPRAHLCFYGLYAPLNEEYLRALGAQTILGGEFEEGLAALARRLADTPAHRQPVQPEPRVSLARQRFRTPDRSGLPPLDKYAYLQLGSDTRRIAGYTEATRGCKHLCRHCPIVPVYQGRFRIVQQEVVLEDIRRQVAAGAQHITFGDPDFFNGPGHALAIVQALHAEFPALTYDVTIKIEHLLKHARRLPVLRETGCVLITSAVESIDPIVLDYLDKGHTREDFIQAVGLCRSAGLVLNPTFVAFTPWTTLHGYVELLALLAELDLIEHVAPIQYAIRLLIPAGSRLLELPQVQALVQGFDPETLSYPWSHPDPRVDRLFAEVMDAVKDGLARNQSRSQVFDRVWRLACAAAGASPPNGWTLGRREGVRAQVLPTLSEPWYC
ncbi:MAG TPA: CUAEP/CCAEP-tail radical SAM protein [Caldilineaceae bacterium]|nr:CUAEP/CCAEP-tail radical SAM protein [Caldilineaceae bacterium]